nr:transcription-repair coupling factor [Pullulanibacillus pueri]
MLEGFSNGMRQQFVAGLSNASKSLWVSSLYEDRHETILVVTHNLFQAQKLYDDLEGLHSDTEVFLYPVNDLIASDIAVASPELLSQRLQALNYLAENKKGIIIVPVAGLKRFIAPEKYWKRGSQTFKVGDILEIEALVQRLSAVGYDREAMVNSPGQYSIRGGIIDIYPLTLPHPVRMELFDDEIDSIRYFDSETQRSLDKIDQVTIGPARELILFPEQYKMGAERLEEALAHTLTKVKNKKVREALSETLSSEIEALKEQTDFQGMMKYTQLYYEEKTTLLNYMPKNTLVVVDEISRVQEAAEQLDQEEAEWLTALLEKGEMVSDLPLSRSWNELSSFSSFQSLFLSLFLRHSPQIQPENIINVTCRAMQNFHGQINVLKNECTRWVKSHFAVLFVAHDKDRAQKMVSVFRDYGIDSEYLDPKTRPTPGTINITVGQLGGGFELVQQKLAVITDQEVFANKAYKSKRRPKKVTNAERLKSYNELKIGDYVVHIDHGIGRYIGIETLEVGGNHKDYLHIRYKGNDKLYVPVEKIDQVQKYVGSEGKEPKLYALGGSEWKRVKTKTKSSVQDIADDLIKLYAEREASKGHAFQPDGPEQREFEAAFPYQETEDQIKAIEEIKQDMEKVRPMDRLLCGDVGYGKTEVALRAAFKAIVEGKQVAFLVPTTILAQQHFETAVERFSDFAVKIGVLNRFRSRKEQQETLKGLKNGTVDLVIGTHRLLSKDITFKDLGLLIVDEEQRFGVTHKEKIKQMKANVDVLTLTATPIPRTLHMSMLGVRDLSILETPPENRFPVQTYVTEYSGALVREAVERELARGGQVYVLYNRVETIQQMANQIDTIIPDARVAYAHGQMKENELESVMIDFLDGAYDVLVSTTIIETGVDIPNVNTLIVYDADRMGLSQLYQLRGRVGRSNRVAYAYFTYHKDKVMNEVAEKRLQAIKEFTELGSGFKIAMRDLSIRGAGNLLGAQQHGFIDSVGFDLYSQMLKEAVEEKTKTTTEQTVKVETNLNIEADAYIPDTYIGDSLQKIDMYKKFKSVTSLNEVAELEEEMVDRFGDYPREVSDLFTVAKIKALATELLIESISEEKNGYVLLFSEEGSGKLDNYQLFEAISGYGREAGLGSEGPKIKVTRYLAKTNSSDQLEKLSQFLYDIYNNQIKVASVS